MSSWHPLEPGVWSRPLTFPPDTTLHVPGDDGRLWDASVPVGAAWTPTMARATFLLAETTGRFTLLTPFETRPAFCEWTLRRLTDRLEVDWTMRLAACRSDRDTAPPPGWVETDFASRSEALDTYRTWMVRAFPQPRRFCPAWAKRIPACVMIQLWAGTGEIDHTLDDLVDLMAAMHAAGVPPETLVYFWGWFAPFDTQYPEYWPAPEVGGEAAMRRVIAAAKRFGYRLMPHTNHHGYNADVPGFADFAADQATDAEGNKLGWREAGEPAIDYLRPKSARWRAHHIARMKRFVDAFPVDAVFWDQYGFIPDDPHCDYTREAHVFSGELQAALPDLLITSELFNERIHDLPIWMHWGTPWCGLPVREEMPHTDLIGSLFQPLFAATYGHQGTPAAVPVPHTWPSYYWFINHHGSPREALRHAHAWHRSVGALPSVRVNFREHGLDPVACAVLKGEPWPT